ncbi:glucosamine--fructose-6-phosphate aminotransferase (isomerizing) [Desulfocicer vacuolatum DSM 3385]|uniref:Glutamine--fructose-6-phosphate aminotransferase [isomerizing] n=1 Tax=Desulfocicer vacuolatum DSM 3385 TaxID=1121400 RepID=A0A1W2BSC6_9BACT|nr:SIS domain-containing protein [Desulfocicer vacuolatum]SMC75853.1 glucosamine--fructose-6-phosphate aminotransferase (isomerizing) [Desulfocicer vacuolatum DSM 3385]
MIKSLLNKLNSHTRKMLSVHVEFATCPHRAAENTLVVFPQYTNAFSCGIAALVAFQGKKKSTAMDLNTLENKLNTMEANLLSICLDQNRSVLSCYLGGSGHMDDVVETARALKENAPFSDIFNTPEKQQQLSEISTRLDALITAEKEQLFQRMALLDAREFETARKRMDACQDAHWCIQEEILKNLLKIENMRHAPSGKCPREELVRFKTINAILNSIDRLEVRGRDSAGISLLATLPRQTFDTFCRELDTAGLGEQLKQRTGKTVLTNNCITIHNFPEKGGDSQVCMAFVYKFAAVIGALGDNVTYLRTQIKNDLILQRFLSCPTASFSISAHTRWASVGSIGQPNCHPVDNQTTDPLREKPGVIHVSLNGDIDNYLALKSAYESRYAPLPEEITTDTKIIPLHIEHYLNKGNPIEEAFRLAVNDFKGSHAISMHTDRAPGKLFLAQKGSGQALFVGLARDHYITASELYGLVEETQDYIKLNGEKKGQIVILDQNSHGGLSGISSLAYDSTPITITEKQILTSEITSRDIDRQHFPHYFLKEISEAPLSVERTLQNRWKTDPETGFYNTALDDTVVPENIKTALTKGTITKIYFIGQGTAGIAAQGCADILKTFLTVKGLDIRAMKASELSGFAIPGTPDDKNAMASYLVVAISQSGTTTDTNRTVDMVKARGAATLAIVNRRDSDLTFKTDGVLYTSSGRDIEMSVASTKAFYAQLTAGALLGLHMAAMLKAVDPEQVTDEINELNQLPGKMKKILAMKTDIKKSAQRVSIAKQYWATVGSGANKTAADEIRIKLSELCYKTISSDYVEDKKHIDLSSEPLIIVCAAGTRESVLGDIIKDTAIFHAHKATTVIIADEGEDRFIPYAHDLFQIPATREHLAPVLTTLVGHIWGYYAALSINDGSRFFYTHQREIKDLIDDYQTLGHDTYEVILEKRFREKIAKFYNEFSQRRRENRFPGTLGIDVTSNITLLCKYLSGRLPVGDFEIDFARKGTPANMLEQFFKTMDTAVNTLARPVDAIKHQAKTVTVGTTRIAQTFEGLIFEELTTHDIQLSQLTNRNVMVIRNLQEVISKINGALLYRISGLTLLGEETPDTRIEVIRKTGTLTSEVSRAETDHRLKGTKNIIVREGNVYIGKGRKDGKSILVIPVISSLPGTSAIEFLLSLNVSFKDMREVPLIKRIKALGGKFIRIKDTVLESDKIKWDDTLLNLIPMEDLFGDSAEKIADYMEHHQSE